MSRTTTARKSKPKRRSLSYNALVGTLHLKQDGKEVGYYLDRLDSPAGKAFRFTKIIPPADGAGCYYVLLSPEGDSCDCKGFRFRQTCKHSAAIRCLAGRGSI